MDENIIVEVKAKKNADQTYENVKIMIDDKVYDTGKTPK